LPLFNSEVYFFFLKVLFSGTLYDFYMLKKTKKRLFIPKRGDNVRLKNLKMPYRTAFFTF